MDAQRLTGPDAGVLKYDMLTALSVAGLSGSPTFQTSMMRLIALVTARYNWRRDEVSVGQRDMARMWAVNERTVKREVKRLTGANILVCLRAGVRGRVGAYRLNGTRIAELSEPCWASVGPDFEDRMRERYGAPSTKVVSLRAYAQSKPEEADDPSPPGTWGRALARLKRDNRALYDAWFLRLEFGSFDRGVLTLRAPSLFIQRYVETHLLDTLLSAVEAELGPVDTVVFD